MTIFLTNASKFCADVHNSDNNPGGIVDLFPCADAKNDHWLDSGGLECGNGGQNVCTEFVDAKNTSVCLAMNGARNVVLQGCGTNGIQDPIESEWIVDTGTENGWRNYSWGGMGDMAVQDPVQNDTLFGVDASDPCGCWWRWSVS